MQIHDKEQTQEALRRTRADIDRIDAHIVDLLSERLAASRAIAAEKSAAGAPIVDEEREQALLHQWRERAAARGLPRQLATAVLERIVDWSRRSQERSAPADAAIRVAYQGEPECYSDLAARKLFELRGRGIYSGVPTRTFQAAFDALERGEVRYALLPVENSLVGAIAEVNAALADGDVQIVDEETLEIEHVLAALPRADIERLTHVHSHPVALRQCRGLFAGRPRWSAVDVHDTAGAARQLAESGALTTGVICSREAAEAYGLKVLLTDIADRDANTTRFLLLAREGEAPPPGVRCKSTLLVALDHAHGALSRFLSGLASRGVNLTRIESRPQMERPWEYLFLVDMLGRADEAPLAEALVEARRHCNTLRVLGSYPTRTAATLATVHEQPRPLAEVPESRAAAVPKSVADRRSDRRTLDLAGAPVGGPSLLLIAGPCAVESEEQIHTAAAMVAARGLRLMRAGAFKPRTSPKSFQGLGALGLRWLVEAARAQGLRVVTEVLSTEDLDLVAREADVIQVGARNMQNFELLKALGRIDKPVLLKRGMSATLDELLGATEYITAGGNQQVVLCERGIRTFETATRFSIDLAAMVVLQARTNLPVIVDPSHAAGRRELVVPLALAAVAAGADGLIVEVHPCREQARCDKEQALTPEDLDRLIAGATPILASQGRTL